MTRRPLAATRVVLPGRELGLPVRDVLSDLVGQRQAAADEAAHLQRRYEQSLEVTTALQRELLPAGLPALPGAQIAAWRWSPS